MRGAVIYVHGKGGSAGEADHFAPLFPDSDVIGFDYRSGAPWEARAEFVPWFEEQRARYGSVRLIANSIGAYFAMVALSARQVTDAHFISPIVDMETLIRDMMRGAGVSEEDLRRQGEIPTAFGETLSWAYLNDVRAHPLRWEVPTRILYGERDQLTSPCTIAAFADRIGAPLTVMPGGEHWFHTPEQMAFLDGWIREASAAPGARQFP